MTLCYLQDFTKIFKKQIFLHKPIEDKNLRIVPGDFRRLFIIDINDIQPEFRRNDPYINLFNVPKTEFSDDNIRSFYYFSDYVYYPYLNYVSVEDMKVEPLKVIIKYNPFIRDEPNNHKKAIIIAKLDKILVEGVHHYYMNFYINNKVIENIRQNKRENRINLLTSILINQKRSDLMEVNNKCLDTILLNTPRKQDFVFQQDQELLKHQVELYNYQKADIDWIRNVENDVITGNNNIKYEYSPSYTVLDNNFLLHNHTLLPIYFGNQNYKISVDFKYYGGNIISEVGLGKTLIMLYHILDDNKKIGDFYSRYVEFTDHCNYFYKRGKSKGTECLKTCTENSLYCKEHKKTPFTDKRSITYNNLDSFDITNYLYTMNNTTYVKTNGSIIICPNHLCDQWIQEYYAKFNATHRIVLIVTSDQYDNVTFGDLLFADLVVVSYNFLTNKKYKEIGFQNFRFISSKIGFDICDPITEEQKLQVLKSRDLNIINMFHWNRVILDEVHEIQNMPGAAMLKNKIKRIHSTYKWNISGTPFANKITSFMNLMSFVSDYANAECDCDVNENTLTTDNLIKWGMESDIVGKSSVLFRRNTKTSIVDEYNGNIIREHLHLLKFTEQERSIYNSYLQANKNNHYDFLIKLCCHPELNNDTREMIKNCKTFDEIQKCMLDFNKGLMTNEEVRMKNAQTDIHYYEIELTKFREPIMEFEVEMMTQMRSKLNIAKRNYTIFKKNYDEISRTFNYLKNSIENLQASDDELTCPICLDDIDRGNIAITKCGHKFCWDCIYETHKAQSSSSDKIKCPTCNSFMKKTELYLLKDSEKRAVSGEISDLDKIIQQTKSTKVGNIIHFLKTEIVENDKVIIFSQWDEILSKVGVMMKDHKLKIVYCRGTVYQRKSAISSFCKDKDINIILLSSKNAASGINLTIANKIILLEPIYGNKQFRDSIESQAIGRADRLGQDRPIDVYRFIIEDTVEQDIYNDCGESNKITQIET
jgi:SNF2 family DNA or RNA helicase